MTMKPIQFNNSAEIQSLDSEKRVAYFKPFDPMEADNKGFQILPEGIEQVSHDFLKDVRIIGIDHNKLASAALVESYRAPTDFYFPDSNIRVHRGSWVVGIKCEDDELWEAAKSGKITGISPAGNYLDYYYDEKTGKTYVKKLTCKELSLLINKSPKNNTPMLFANSEDKNKMNAQDNQKDLEKLANDKKAAQDAALKSDEAKKVAELESQKSKADIETLVKSQAELIAQLKANQEAIQKADPNYAANQAAKERQDLISSLSKSNLPEAKEFLVKLQNPDDSSYEDTNIEPPDNQVFPQKRSPNKFINPKDLQDRTKVDKPKEISEAAQKEVDAIREKYKNDRTLPITEKYRELDRVAEKYNL
jgi:hypothetical protein